MAADPAVVEPAVGRRDPSADLGQRRDAVEVDVHGVPAGFAQVRGVGEQEGRLAVATRPGDPDVGAVGGGQVELMQLLAAVDQGIGRDRALEREGAVHGPTLAVMHGITNTCVYVRYHTFDGARGQTIGGMVRPVGPLGFGDGPGFGGDGDGVGEVDGGFGPGPGPGPGAGGGW